MGDGLAGQITLSKTTLRPLPAQCTLWRHYLCIQEMTVFTKTFQNGELYHLNNR